MLLIHGKHEDEIIIKRVHIKPNYFFIYYFPSSATNIMKVQLETLVEMKHFTVSFSEAGNLMLGMISALECL